VFKKQFATEVTENTEKGEKRNVGKACVDAGIHIVCFAKKVLPFFSVTSVSSVAKGI
jgi:hypothetical protein